MLKSTMLCALLLSCGFSARAADTETKIGEYGLNSVSEIVQFYTGNGNLWTNKGVRVYHENGKTPYAKTVAQMKRLPAGTIVRIKESLVKTKTVHVPVVQTVAEFCNGLNPPLWKCQDRLLAFNGNAAKLDTWTVPNAATIVLVYRAPAPANPAAQKTRPASVVDLDFPSTHWEGWFWLFLISTTLAGVLLILLATNTKPWQGLVSHCRQWRATRRTSYEDAPTRRVARRDTIVTEQTARNETEQTRTQP